MQIEDFPTMRTEAKLYQELAQLDLLENIAELEVFGFTVVPPEKVGPPEFHEAVKQATIDVVENRFGPLNEDGTSWADKNQIIRMILWENPIFEELILNPAGLGLVQHLIGANCLLALCNGWVKGPGTGVTPLHQDNYDFTRKAKAPEANSANFNYLVTDYSAEAGGLGFVPGSHRWRRPPSPAESAEMTKTMHVPEAPAGSMLVWGDLTWHASTPRTLPGERLMVLGHFCRAYMQTQEAYRQTVTQEALARNPKRFAGLMDVYGAYPWGKADVDIERLTAGASVASGSIDATPYHSLFDREPAGDAVSTRPAYDYLAFDADAFEKQLVARAARMKQMMEASKPAAAANGADDAEKEIASV